MTDPEQSQSTRAGIRIEGEHETSNGWLYTFAVDWADSEPTDHELTMSWVDHEHLVGGLVTPSRLAQISAMIAAEHFGVGSLPERFDLSTLRRLVAGFDDLVRDQC